MKASNTLLGVLGAAAIGAVVGVLFAPDKGSKTRKKIADKSKDYSGELKTKLDEVVSSISANGRDFLENGKAKFNEMKDEATNEARNVRNDIKSTIN